MKLKKIADSNINNILSSEYDLAVFASGYESRCIALPGKVTKKNVSKAIVLGFEHQSDCSLRVEHDGFYQAEWELSPIVINTTSDTEIYAILNSALGGLEKENCKILIDYSSMSRTWYSAILNWVRFNDHFQNIEIDFVYTSGIYSENLTPSAISSILPLPGCEGTSGVNSKSIAVFGLGFEGLAPLCVLDKLQPDFIFTYLANPAFIENYPLITRKQNEELISMAKATLEYPIDSVEVTFVKLAELVSQYIGVSDITFVPMGPKPHVLAAILLALHYDQITCLHVQGQAKAPKDVPASDNFVITNLIFE